MATTYSSASGAIDTSDSMEGSDLADLVLLVFLLFIGLIPVCCVVWIFCCNSSKEKALKDKSPLEVQQIVYTLHSQDKL